MHTRRSMKLGETLSKNTSLAEAFEFLFKNAGDAIFILNAKGKIVALNEQAEKMTKPNYKYFIGRSFRSIISPAMLPKAQRSFQTVMKGKTARLEFKFRRTTGQTLLIEITIMPCMSEGKPVAVLGIARDITEQRDAEQKLRESEERYRKLVETLPEGVYTVGLDGTIKSLNATFEKITGWPCKKWIGKSFAKLIHPDDLPLALKTFRKSVEGKIQPLYELRILTKSGKYIVGEFMSQPQVENGKIIGEFGIVRDVTERKCAQEALTSNEERFRTVADTAADAIITANAQGTIAFWNKAAESIFGYSPDEAVGKSISIIAPESFRFQYGKVMRQLATSREKEKNFKPYEFVGLKKNGQAVPLELSFSTWKTTAGSFLTAIIRDITERKKAEEALLASEAKFRTLFENVPDGFYQSTPDGKIITANPALMHMLGYSSLDELRALNISRDLYVNPVDRRSWMRRINEKNQLRNAELILKRKDGQKLIALENSNVIRDKQGRIINYEGTLTDITERKNLEDRLSALNFYGGKLNAAQSLQRVYDLTLDALGQTLGFENVAFVRVTKGNLKTVCQRGHPLPLSELPLKGRKGVTVKVARTGRPVLVADVKRCSYYIEGIPGVQSELAVPVMTENKVLGVLNLESKKLGAFDERDMTLLQILASHAATAISNLNKQEENEKRSVQLALLMKHSAEMIHYMSLHQRLQKIAEAIRELGWRRVVIRAVRDEKMNLESPEDLMTAGLTEKERTFLWKHRMPGHVWHERFGPDFERFRVGEFYHLPWSDPWVREKFSKGTVPSRLTQKDMVDWDPQDLLYAPLRLADGRIVGILSIDDPVDGRRPTRDSLTPLELFIHQAAVAIDNAQLFEQLEKAKNQVKEYAKSLEEKVKERTMDLRKSEEKLRSIITASPSAITVADLEGKITECNGQTLKLHGYSSKAELIGKNAFDLIVEREHQKAFEDMNRVLKEELVSSFEYTLVRKDGGEFPAELSASVVKDASGVPVGLVAMATDITERKRMEQQLLKSERLAAMGEVAAMVGHDLRNPLTGIAGATYFLKMKLNSRGDIKRKREMLDLIEKDIEYSNKIVNDLLDYSREIHLDLTETTPRVIVRDTLSMVKVPDGITVLNKVQRIPKLSVDCEKLKRVFLNIMKNAFDAMPKGGQLMIKSKIVGDCTEFVFADTGLGMTQHTLDEIFAPLFTTKAKGMGFGLAICKRIVEAHCGRISVESEPAKGTMFTVTVPIEQKIEGGEKVWVNVPRSLLSTTMRA